MLEVLNQGKAQNARTPVLPACHRAFGHSKILTTR